jgi:hypothetical protein
VRPQSRYLPMKTRVVMDGLAAALPPLLDGASALATPAAS